jgi:pantothenate kinase
MTEDTIFIAKPDGARLGPCKSALSASSCTIFDNNVSISHSTDFQVGDNNLQNIQNTFRALEKAIDAQVASEEVKADAKSKLQAVLQHPLVVAVLGGAAGGIAG